MRALIIASAAAALLCTAAAQADLKERVEKGFKPVGHIHGYLVDASGKGISGVIELCTPDGSVISRWDSTAFKFGRFDIDNLQPGRYRLHVNGMHRPFTDVRPPADMDVTIKPKKTIHPRLIAQSVK